MTSTARDRGPDPLDNPRQFEAAWHAVARCFADGAEVAPTRSREFYQEIAFEVLRALAGEAEPDGSGPEEVWIPPSTDCMDHAHEPCPHCGSRIHHMRTDRCGTCGRRPVPAGGSAPADEVEEPAATCPLCARTVRLVLDVHGHLGPDVEAEDEVICDASHWRPSWAAERATDPDAKPWITVPPESAGGSAPHQGATTDVTALLAHLDWLDERAMKGGHLLLRTDDVRALLAGKSIPIGPSADRALLGAGETTDVTAP